MFEYCEEFRDIKIVINEDSSEIHVLHKNSGNIFTKAIHIWNPAFSLDFWIRDYLSNEIIVISDYNGLTIYNNKLEVKHVSIIEDNKKYDNVYGFSIMMDHYDEPECIKYWLINKNDISNDSEIDHYSNSSNIVESKIFKYYFT
jgi:hypothetical protein